MNRVMLVLVCLGTVLGFLYHPISSVECSLLVSGSMTECSSEVLQLVTNVFKNKPFIVPVASLDAELLHYGYQTEGIERVFPSRVIVQLKPDSKLLSIETDSHEWFVLSGSGKALFSSQESAAATPVTIHSLPADRVKNVSFLNALVTQMKLVEEDTQNSLREPINLVWQSPELLTTTFDSGPVYLLHPSTLSEGIRKLRVLRQGSVPTAFVPKEIDLRFRLPVARPTVTMGIPQIATPSTHSATRSSTVKP